MAVCVVALAVQVDTIRAVDMRHRIQSRDEMRVVVQRAQGNAIYNTYVCVHVSFVRRNSGMIPQPRDRAVNKRGVGAIRGASAGGKRPVSRGDSVRQIHARRQASAGRIRQQSRQGARARSAQNRRSASKARQAKRYSLLIQWRCNKCFI
jgi:hypothetical protein